MHVLGFQNRIAKTSPQDRPILVLWLVFNILPGVLAAGSLDFGPTSPPGGLNEFLKRAEEAQVQVEPATGRAFDVGRKRAILGQTRAEQVTPSETGGNEEASLPPPPPQWSAGRLLDSGGEPWAPQANPSPDWHSAGPAGGSQAAGLRRRKQQAQATGGSPAAARLLPPGGKAHLRGGSRRPDPNPITTQETKPPDYGSGGSGGGGGGGDGAAAHDYQAASGLTATLSSPTSVKVEAAAESQQHREHQGQSDRLLASAPSGNDDILIYLPGPESDGAAAAAAAAAAEQAGEDKHENFAGVRPVMSFAGDDDEPSSATGTSAFSAGSATWRRPLPHANRGPPAAAGHSDGKDADDDDGDDDDDDDNDEDDDDNNNDEPAASAGRHSDGNDTNAHADEGRAQTNKPAGGEQGRAKSASGLKRRDKEATNLASPPPQSDEGAPALLPMKRSRRFCIYLPAPVNHWHCQGYEMMGLPAELTPKPVSLLLSGIGIETLARSHLEPYKETLRDFSIENAPNLTTIEWSAFANWPKLRVVYIIQAPRLVSFDFAIVGRHPDLTTIRIQQTGLRAWPDLSKFEQQKILTSVDLDNNKIENLGTRPINIRAELVNLEFNHITSVAEHTFNGSEIGTLSLSGNRQLSFIHPNAFANLKNLIKLDLSSTSVAQLPTVGLHQLRHLAIRDNHALRQIPSIYVFPMLEEAHLTYAYHCCSFRYPKTHDPHAYEEHVRLQNAINALCNAKRGAQQEGGSGGTPTPGDNNNQPQQQQQQQQDLARSSRIVPTRDLSSSTLAMPSSTTEGFEGIFDVVQTTSEPPSTDGSSGPPSGGQTSPSDWEGQNSISDPATGGSAGSTSVGWSPPIVLPPGSVPQNIECGELVLNASVQNITCTPENDAFNPCEDIMGYSVLRVAVWFVVACSVFGNMSVIVVLLGIFRRLSVPKFLQLNLAIGDLVMGVYLAMLAAADLTTKGTYFNYANDWQHGLGCRLAGASSLFASQLSIFTLIVITFERYYTITYTIDLNMRLQLGWAARIMLFGWFFAFGAAMLPVFGHINSYSKTSICLPMRTTYKLDRLFIIILLVIDSCAFLIIFICYLRMYLLILKQRTEATLKERTVAMRMALLVFTDFACWAPIIFFGATAVFGHPLISVTNSKILIVFFYPLNSMANPFLYVLSTRQYRRDLNYVLSRWRHWRKNLFKSQEDKDYSFNNNNPYGIMAKYPPAMNAHLGAVAAMTGVANHLHHYRMPLNCYNGEGGQQVELVKLTAAGPPSDDGPSNEAAQCHHHHHHNHDHHRGHNNHRHNHHSCRNHRSKRHKTASNQCIGTKGIRPQEQRLAICHAEGQKGPNRNGQKSATAQYIIRHQILPEKHGGHHHPHNCLGLNPARSVRPQPLDQAQTKQGRVGHSLEGSKQQQLERDKEPNLQDNNGVATVKLGHVIDDKERVSSLMGSEPDERTSASTPPPHSVEMSKLVLVGSVEYRHSIASLCRRVDGAGDQPPLEQVDENRNHHHSDRGRAESHSSTSSIKRSRTHLEVEARDTSQHRQLTRNHHTHKRHHHGHHHRSHEKNRRASSNNEAEPSVKASKRHRGCLCKPQGNPDFYDSSEHCKSAREGSANGTRAGLGLKRHSELLLAGSVDTNEKENGGPARQALSSSLLGKKKFNKSNGKQACLSTPHSAPTTTITEPEPTTTTTTATTTTKTSLSETCGGEQSSTTATSSCVTSDFPANGLKPIEQLQLALTDAKLPTDQREVERLGVPGANARAGDELSQGGGCHGNNCCKRRHCHHSSSSSSPPTGKHQHYWQGDQAARSHHDLDEDRAQRHCSLDEANSKSGHRHRHRHRHKHHHHHHHHRDHHHHHCRHRHHHSRHVREEVEDKEHRGRDHHRHHDSHHGHEHRARPKRVHLERSASARTGLGERQLQTEATRDHGENDEQQQAFRKKRDLVANDKSE